MDSILAGIFGISALVVIVLTFLRSVSRTKSATRWLKGYNLKSRMSEEAVLDLLNRVKYPQKVSASVGTDGKMVFQTKQYSYPVEISNDENGCTTVAFLINWARVSKFKRKKVAFDWDNVYQFLKQEVEGVDVMQAYEKSLKMQKILNIASVVCVISFLIILVIG